jgi:putative oxidoreductase
MERTSMDHRPAGLGLDRVEPYTWTLFRVVVGVVMSAHGWMKLTSFDATVESFGQIGFGTPEAMVWLAIAGELLGGIGLILGAVTRVAALGVVSVMIVAIATVHAGHGLMAANNGFEYPLVLLVAALAFVARGSGPFGVDAWVRHVRSERGGHRVLRASGRAA